MARTDLVDPRRQRSLPLGLLVIALLLLLARIAWQVWQPEDANRDLVRWVTPEEAERIAATAPRPMLLDFTAAWCAPCDRLDEEVFRNPEIAAEINERFLPVRVVDRQREDGRNSPLVDRLQKRHDARAFPTIVFTDAGGKAIARMEGYRDAQTFAQVLASAR